MTVLVYILATVAGWVIADIAFRFVRACERIAAAMEQDSQSNKRREASQSGAIAGLLQIFRDYFASGPAGTN